MRVKRLYCKSNANVGALDSSGAITLKEGGLVYIEITPDLDRTRIVGKGKPTHVVRGIYEGYSLPVFNTDDEELFFTICVPNRYDEVSDIKAHVVCWLAQAEDNKNFKLQLSWQHFTSGVDEVPSTFNDVEIQTASGVSVAQFQSYSVSFVFDYDIDKPDNVISNDILGLRLRRIAADADECDGEIVITHVGVIFRRDKLGTEVP